MNEIVTDLKKLIGSSKLELNVKIVRFLYQFKIAEKFQEYYEEAFNMIKEKETTIKQIFECVKNFFPEFKFTFYGQKDSKFENLSSLKYFFTKIEKLNFEEEIPFWAYLENDNMSSKIRTFLLKKLIDERWKLTCLKVMVAF